MDDCELFEDTIIIRKPDKILAYSFLKKIGAQIEGQEMKKARSLLTSAGFFNATDSLETIQDYSGFNGLMLLLGRACPLRCVYCYAEAGESSELMSLNTAKHAMEAYIALAKSKKRLRVNFHGGGEPTANREVIKYLVENYTGDQFSWRLTTSGVMPKSFLDWLIDNNVGMCISVDGPPDIQNDQRPLRGGKSSSGKVETTLRTLRERDQHINIRATLTKATIGRLVEILSYFSSMSVDSMHLEALYSIGRAMSGETSMPESVHNDDWVDGAKFALKWARENNKKVRVAALNFIFNPGMKSYCGAACGKSLVVTHDGIITGCSEVVDSTMPESEIFHLGFLKNGEPQIDKRKARYLAQRVPVNMPSCQNCFARFVCRGGCLHKGWSATGDIYEPEEAHCNFVKSMIPFILERAITGAYNKEAMDANC